MFFNVHEKNRESHSHVTNRVGGDMQSRFKLHPITLPDRPGLPNFLVHDEKTWEGLGTRLQETVLHSAVNVVIVLSF